MLYAEYMVSIVKSYEFFPTTKRNILNFVSYLFDRGLVCSTILTYLSAIAFFCKMLSLPDHTNSFIVRKLLVAVKRTTGQPDSRLPISPNILMGLALNVPFIGLNLYDQITILAMYLLAFHGFLRVGEFTVKPNVDPSKIIQLNDIAFEPNFKGAYNMILTIRYFKGNVSATPVYISMPSSPGHLLCPQMAMVRYLSVRGQQPGPLFKWSNGQFVSREHFAALLKLNLIASGFPAGNYKTHSFRIGACSFASSNGLSDDQIMKIGRWKSTAFQKYIRMPTRFAKPL